MVSPLRISFRHLRLFTSHTKPEEDTENSSLFVEEVTVDGDWTSVTFYRHSSDLDDEASP